MKQNPPPRRRPRLGRGRIIAALLIAIVADGLQILLLPFAWFIDVVAMAATMLLLGFHPLLLPTFLVELFPLVDALPTWTGCVSAVILLQRRSERQTEITISPPPAPPEVAPPRLLPPPK